MVGPLQRRDTDVSRPGENRVANRAMHIVRSVLVLILLSLCPLNSQAAHITVRVDRDPVAIDESFQIILTSDERNSDRPDLSPLQKDFEVLSQSQSSNLQIINGRMSQQTRWTLLAMARHPGQLTIPAIQIGGDHSPAITVTVTAQANRTHGASGQDRDLFIQVEAQPDNSYVQAQILYTIRFYRSINISGARMSEPDFGGHEVVVQKLGDGNTFETRRNGRRYIVVERKYALFPQKSGELIIQPINLDVQIPVASRGFFDPLGQNATTKRLHSKRLTLHIKAIPDTVKGGIWLPARQISLSEGWPQRPTDFVVGEPITRTLTLQAEGLTAAQLPTLAMTATPDFKTYPDQPKVEDKTGPAGIIGTRQEKIALIPTRAGPLTLPKITIHWWNTRQQRLEMATLPARTIQVLPSPELSASPPTRTTVTPKLNSNPGPDSVPNTAATPQTGDRSNKANPLGSFKHYDLLSLALGLGWLLTLMAWAIHSRKRKDRASRRTGTAKTSLAAVKKACLGNDPQAARAALLAWGCTRWPDDPPANLGTIGMRLNTQVQQEIGQLNHRLYSAPEQNWQGSALWQGLSTMARTQDPGPAPKKTALEPLYPGTNRP